MNKLHIEKKELEYKRRVATRRLERIIDILDFEDVLEFGSVENERYLTKGVFARLSGCGFNLGQHVSVGLNEAKDDLIISGHYLTEEGWMPSGCARKWLEKELRINISSL